jgi:hypothetical protein
LRDEEIDTLVNYIDESDKGYFDFAEFSKKIGPEMHNTFA